MSPHGKEEQKENKVQLSVVQEEERILECEHRYRIGDSFITNCKTCGLYFPRDSDKPALRPKDKAFECHFFISDLLKEAYTRSLNIRSIQMPPQYAEHRHHLIDWLAAIVDKVNLQKQTLHRAVHIMDLFISMKFNLPTKDDVTMIISQEQYKLCAITCLFIAAKSFEIEEIIPKSCDLVKMMNETSGEEIISDITNTFQLIPDCERQVLNTLDWNFESEPTFNSIIENFLAMGILLEQDRSISVVTSKLEPLNENTLILVEKYVNLYSVLALQESSLVGKNPYLLACGIIASARQAAGILNFKTPDRVWPPELVQLTGLQFVHFEAYYGMLMKLYQTKFIQQLPSLVQQSQENQNQEAGSKQSSKKRAINKENEITTKSDGGQDSKSSKQRARNQPRLANSSTQPINGGFRQLRSQRQQQTTDEGFAQ
ncbi:hypothetical protein FGO68_gene6144 [Halteria grandinella]|uniref:Cyclin-like domain-containing protein n=1 Tax=Halteria grandinella TaxID=5974 RepID=A0A8J8NZ35_HALGN|nr:hypothetical protein FGO68_gene6144 [Halteria grandinella]